MKLVFVHIPKTAGTSFWKILENSFGIKNTIWDQHNTLRPKFTDPKDHIKFDIIYGHFTIEKYQHLDRPKVTIMRDPIERVISEYYYTIKIIKYGNEKNLTISPHINEFRSVCDWAEFRPNIQYNFIKDVSNFDWIGLVEHFNRSINQFESIFNVSLNKKTIVERINKDKDIVNAKEREYIKQFNKLDYELYNEVLKRYGKE